MNRSTAISIFWIVIGVAMSVTSLVLAKYYFTFDEKNLKAVKETQELVYDKVNSSWLKPDLAQMNLNLGTPELGEFEKMILRTAMGRWRIKSIAPHAYINVVKDYKTGLWDSEFVQGLTPWLLEIDNEWISARKAALKVNTVAEARFTTAPNEGLNVLFFNETTTAEIGSEITLLFTVASESNPLKTVDVHWDTFENPGITMDRCRKCVMEATGRSLNNLPIFKLVIDMSDSPEWLVPTVRPQYFFVRGPAPVFWSPVAYKFSDNALLPISKETITSGTQS